MEFAARAWRVTDAGHAFIFKDLAFAAPEGRGAQPLDRLLRERHDGASWAEVRRLIETGKVSVNGAVQRETALRVASGAQIELRMAARAHREGPRLAAGAIVHVDPHVVVVQKPAGISTVPYDENETGTLDELVRAELGRKEARSASCIASTKRRRASCCSRAIWRPSSSSRTNSARTRCVAATARSCTAPSATARSPRAGARPRRRPARFHEPSDARPRIDDARLLA